MSMTLPAKAGTLVTVCLSLLGGAATAAEVHQAKVERHGVRYTAHVVSTMRAPIAGVRAMLMDFDHLERIHRSVVASEHLNINRDGSDRVRIEMYDCVLIFCTGMQHVANFRRLEKTDLTAEVDGERSDFRYGQLSWHLTESLGAVDDATPRTHLVFRAEIEPAFWVPPLVGPLIVKKKLRELAIGISHNLERGAAGKTR